MAKKKDFARATDIGKIMSERLALKIIIISDFGNYS